MLVVKATAFSEQFLNSYTVIPIIFYSLYKLVFNTCTTLAITSNVLLKASCVNHKTEFNTKSEPSDRIELSGNT